MKQENKTNSDVTSCYSLPEGIPIENKTNSVICSMSETLYSFNDLKKEVQDKIIDKSYDINIDDDWWDFLYEDFKLELENINYVSCKDFTFSLDRDYFLKLHKPYILNERKFLEATGNRKELFLLDLLENMLGDNTIELSITEGDGYFSVGIYLYTSLNIESENRRREIWLESEKITDRIENNINNHMKNLKNDFLKRLQEHYDYITSDEAIRETIIANDYLFTEDGIRG